MTMIYIGLTIFKEKNTTIIGDVQLVVQTFFLLMLLFAFQIIEFSYNFVLISIFFKKTGTNQVTFCQICSKRMTAYSKDNMGSKDSNEGISDEK